MASYQPIFDLPENLRRYTCGIQISEAAEAVIERVLAESELQHPIPVIFCGAHPENPDENEYRVGIFDFGNIDDVVEVGRTSSNYMSKIGNHDFVLLQTHRLVDAGVTKIDYRDNSFVFE